MPYGDGSRSDGPVPGKALVKAFLVFAGLVLAFILYLNLTGKG